MVVISEKTRRQLLNQADCLDRIRVMIRDASVKPYVPTQEDLDRIRERYEYYLFSLLNALNATTDAGVAWLQFNQLILPLVKSIVPGYC